MKSFINYSLRVIALVVVMLAFASPAHAQMQKYAGKVDGKYKVVLYLAINDNTGTVNGKYAYISSLRKYGDKPSSWLTIRGKYTGSGSGANDYECVVTESSGKVAEYWTLWRERASGKITGWITTPAGKEFPLEVIGKLK